MGCIDCSMNRVDTRVEVSMSKKTFLVTLVAAALVAWIGSELRAHAQAISKGALITATTTVKKVDASKREVTVAGADGNPVIINVPSDVQGLDNVKPGDKLDVSYYESVVFSLRKPGETGPRATSKSTEQPTSGAMPGGTASRQISATVRVVKIDRDANKLTIRSPNGEMDTIHVTDPQNQNELRKLKVGDELQVTYTEAMASAIRPS
jgi:Cu/Ag efflux protein CusF